MPSSSQYGSVHDLVPLLRAAGYERENPISGLTASRADNRIFEVWMRAGDPSSMYMFETDVYGYLIPQSLGLAIAQSLQK